LDRLLDLTGGSPSGRRLREEETGEKLTGPESLEAPRGRGDPECATGERHRLAGILRRARQTQERGADRGGVVARGLGQLQLLPRESARLLRPTQGDEGVEGRAEPSEAERLETGRQEARRRPRQLEPPEGLSGPCPVLRLPGELDGLQHVARAR